MEHPYLNIVAGIVVIANNSSFQILCAQEIIYTILFNPHYNPMRYYLCFTDEEIG